MSKTTEYNYVDVHLVGSKMKALVGNKWERRLRVIVRGIFQGCVVIVNRRKLENS